MGEKKKRISKAAKRIQKLVRQVREKKVKKVRLVNYKITYDAMIEPNFSRLPEQVKERFYDLHDMLKTKPRTVIPELIELIEKYPNVPTLRNNLGVAYSSAGEIEKMEEVTIENCRLNPDYLFGKLNYAQLCLMRKEYDKIPEIFNHTFDLKELYPNREEFHISEFVNFMGIMGEYHFHTGNREQTQAIYEMLRKVAPDDQNTDNLEFLLS